MKAEVLDTVVERRGPSRLKISANDTLPRPCPQLRTVAGGPYPAGLGSFWAAVLLESRACCQTYYLDDEMLIFYFYENIAAIFYK
jgi:hypothetical protein